MGEAKASRPGVTSGDEEAWFKAGAEACQAPRACGAGMALGPDGGGGGGGGAAGVGWWPFSPTEAPVVVAEEEEEEEAELKKWEG